MKLEDDHDLKRKVKGGADLQFEIFRSLDSLPEEIKVGIDEAIQNTLSSGPLMGFPLIDIRARVVGGLWSSLRSNESIFR